MTAAYSVSPCFLSELTEAGGEERGEGQSYSSMVGGSMGVNDSADFKKYFKLDDAQGNSF